MKNMFVCLGFAALIMLMAGCSDDDNPIIDGGSTTAGFQDTTIWDDAGNFWNTTINAGTATGYFYFGDTSGTAKSNNALTWHIALYRNIINLNGGDYTSENGDVIGADLGAVNFDNVTITDTTGAAWIEDNNDYFFGDNWYTYNHPMFVVNQRVWLMADADGDNFIKFRIDSLVGAAQPPDMGTVHFTYYYQPQAGSTDLSGATMVDSIVVGSGTGYYDFSNGSQVTPANPSNATDWDISFSMYDLKQNSGPNGIGQCAGFPAYGELNDPTDIDELTEVPAGAPLFADYVSSALYQDPNDDTQNWYDYQPDNNHRLVSWGNVYLIMTEGKVFKLEILDYYDNNTGKSGYYTFKWKQL